VLKNALPGCGADRRKRDCSGFACRQGFQDLHEVALRVRGKK